MNGLRLVSIIIVEAHVCCKRTKYLNATMQKGKCVRKSRPSFGEYTITSIIYSNVVAVECVEEDIRSYQ